jgi:hypothetical protein
MTKTKPPDVTKEPEILEEGNKVRPKKALCKYCLLPIDKDHCPDGCLPKE